MKIDCFKKSENPICKDFAIKILEFFRFLDIPRVKIFFFQKALNGFFVDLKISVGLQNT